MNVQRINKNTILSPMIQNFFYCRESSLEIIINISEYYANSPGLEDDELDYFFLS